MTKTVSNKLNYPLQKYEYTSRTELSTTGDVVEGSYQITNLASTLGLAAGQDVVMDGIPKWSKVVSIVGTTANISSAATKTATTSSVDFLGNTLYGITPDLPNASSLNEFSLSSLSRSFDIVTGTTSSSHNYEIGDLVIISGSDGVTVANGNGDTVLNSYYITNFSPSTGIVMPGQLVYGPGIQANTEVVSVNLTTITISKKATSSNVGSTYSFSESLNGSFAITSAAGNTFTYNLSGANGLCSVSGSARVEKIGLANSGSKIICIDSVSNSATRITGTSVWDEASSFVISGYYGAIQDQIQSGKIVRSLNLSSGSGIPLEGGYIVFDFGLSTQEGPVRYLYRPSDSTIVLDPSYVFNYTHQVGSTISYINKKGPHIVSTTAKEYPAYITDPSEARFILQDLIKSVKSAGIFVNFLVRYPEQLYGTLDVYDQQGLGAGAPFAD